MFVHGLTLLQCHAFLHLPASQPSQNARLSPNQHDPTSTQCVDIPHTDSTHPHLLLISSGPMYSGVPMRIVFMFDVCSQCLAKPKSHSLTQGGLWESSSVLSSLRSLRQREGQDDGFVH